MMNHAWQNAEKSHIILFLLVTLIDSVCKIGENYYPQVFLDECKRVGYDSDDSEDFDAQDTTIILLNIKNAEYKLGRL